MIDRQIGDRRGEGADLANLGDTYFVVGEKEMGIELMKQSLEIFDAIESPYAQAVRNVLNEWDEPE